MEYVHPKQYIGVKFDTPCNQEITRNKVEEYCLKCDLFIGQEHDFSECQFYDKWEDGKVIKKKTCPFNSTATSIIQPIVKCKVED